MNINELFELGMKRIIPDLITPSVYGSIFNLGAGNQIIDRAIVLDLPGWDAEKDDIPALDNSVKIIYAFHFLEHLKDPVRILLECQRVLKEDGVMNIVVPYYNSSMQAQDLDHKSCFNETTWKTLFSNQYYDENKIEWKFKINTNIIIGVVERNLCLMTQLIKE